MRQVSRSRIFFGGDGLQLMTRTVLNESIAAVTPKVKVTQTHFVSHAILALSPAETFTLLVVDI
jgi:hypothetical protein